MKYVYDELSKLIGKEIEVIKIDKMLDEHCEEAYDGLIRPDVAEFTTKNRLYELRVTYSNYKFYANVQYTINKNTISMIDIVKVTNVEVFE